MHVGFYLSVKWLLGLKCSCMQNEVCHKNITAQYTLIIVCKGIKNLVTFKNDDTYSEVYQFF